MSFGIIGVSPPTLKIANGVQKINKVHTCNQNVSQELNMYNSENYTCVADLMVNMDRPRIIVTACKNVKDVRPTLTRILEWSDPEDTIINCTHEHYKHSMYYENECSNKNVHYLSASLTNDAFLVGGQNVFSNPTNLFSIRSPKMFNIPGICRVRDISRKWFSTVSSVPCFKSSVMRLHTVTGTFRSCFHSWIRQRTWTFRDPLLIGVKANST